MIAQNAQAELALSEADYPLEILLTLARIEGKLDYLRVSLDACVKVLNPTNVTTVPAGAASRG